MAKMKNNKGAGLSGNVSEMSKASREVGPEWVTDACNAVDKIPEHWNKSWLDCVYINAVSGFVVCVVV